MGHAGKTNTGGIVLATRILLAHLGWKDRHYEWLMLALFNITLFSFLLSSAPK